MSQSNVIDFFTAAYVALRFDYISNVTKKRAHLNVAIANRNIALRKDLAKKRARSMSRAQTRLAKQTQILLNKQTQTNKEVSNGTN